MNSELLSRLYHRFFYDPKLAHTQGCTYCDALILFIWFAGASDNISPRQGCRKGNWPITYRRLKFPSYSQFIKRLNQPAFQDLLHAFNAELKDLLPRSDEKVADGKPLVIGGYSKDPDADEGHIPDGWATGYKLHVIADSLGVIEQFDVTSLSGGEPTVLRTLLPAMELRGTVLRTDSNYDSNAAYADVAARGGRLIAPRKKPHTSLGHHPQHADRLAAIELLEGARENLKQHKLLRNRVEQIFAQITGMPLGALAHLPNFVRRHKRVHRWVTTKIILYHLNLVAKLSEALAA